MCSSAAGPRVYLLVAALLCLQIALICWRTAGRYAFQFGRILSFSIRCIQVYHTSILDEMEGASANGRGCKRPFICSV